MIQSVKTQHTRGEWRHNELKVAVLLVLKAAQAQGVPGLTLRRIYELIGVNYGSLHTLLPKWTEWGLLSRGQRKCRPDVGPIYLYKITPAREDRFETFTEGYISKRKRKWVQVDTLAIIKRRPCYKG